MSKSRADDALFVGVVTFSEKDRAEIMTRILAGITTKPSAGQSWVAAALTYEATLRALELELEERDNLIREMLNEASASPTGAPPRPSPSPQAVSAE